MDSRAVYKGICRVQIINSAVLVGFVHNIKSYFASSIFYVPNLCTVRIWVSPFLVHNRALESAVNSDVQDADGAYE